MRDVGVVTLLVLGAAASAAEALTADELIAKHIEALGGREKLAAITSLRATGKSIMGGDDFVMEMSTTVVKARGGKMRQERSLQGLTGVTAIAGDKAWSLQPFGGRREPDWLPPDAVKSLMVEADIDGPLVDHEAKGHRVEYLGTEDVDGTEAHKLRIALADGNERYVFLDPDYFLVIRTRSRNMVRGVEQEMETDLGNYELVDGVYMPFSSEKGAPGGPRFLKVTLEKVEANVPVDDALFAFPESAAKPAAKPAEGGQR